ncbi:hypothetical protein ANN_20734 [Periplaneta americana]|uniref:Uncharacterized protein n=1 Tax=Periplaneta americana TaxID=6978 RepID=A0ABQ8SDH1_PERAM|nr:hypothetical protein ANN_20734 [Periplaneta americana]
MVLTMEIIMFMMMVMLMMMMTVQSMLLAGGVTVPTDVLNKSAALDEIYANYAGIEYITPTTVHREGHRESVGTLHKRAQVPGMWIEKAILLRWAGHVTRVGESRNAYRVLVGRPEGKRPLGRPRRRWEDNIKMDLRDVGYDDRGWINLAQDRDRWRAYVRAAMNFRNIKIVGRSIWRSSNEKTQVYAWHKRFSGGRDSIKDDVRSGRPTTATNEAIAQQEETILRDMLLDPNDSYEQYGMKINANKTKTMVVGRKINKVNLRILNEAIEQVDSFNYFGRTISSNMSCSQEVKRKIAMTKEAFNRKRSIFCGPLEKELRKILVKCFVWNVALSMAEEKLPTERCTERNGEREKSSGQKKISDDRRD